MQNDDQLNYCVSGEGRATIFLHGFLESSGMWETLQLPVHIQAIFVDLPGHGQSTSPQLLCDSMEAMATKVSSVADELGLEAFDVIGHSMGGYVALALKKSDQRCHKVMLVNSNFWADSAEKKSVALVLPKG